MNRRYTEEQIVKILQEAQAGTRAEDLCRKYNVALNTFYRWKQKYGGMEVSDVKKLRSLEDENRRLKQMVAEQALELRAAKDLLSKNW
ncbi:MAG: transposase [Elusimicrobia bacterium GWC2_64_44]|nr:MAG: transposase [Elusimicrobia bacterium GWC2_64_44]